MADGAKGSLRVRGLMVEARVKALEESLNEEVPNKAGIILRMNDLTSLFRTYEAAYEELLNHHKDLMEIDSRNQIHTLYYEVASKVEELKTTDPNLLNSSLLGPPNNHSSFTEKPKQLKLPVAPIPKFNGDYIQWLSFKNAFMTMVNARTDYDDVSKLIQLRSALEGDALKKIESYDISSENYPLAWKTLEEIYERKRILVSKHIDAILDLVPATEVTSSGLTKLTDELRTHLNALKSLKMPEETRFFVRIAERALPIKIRQKWEQFLKLDALPSTKDFFDFMNETIFRLHTQEMDEARETREVNAGKRVSLTERPVKIRRNDSGARALVVEVETTCIFCLGSHWLYQCPKFKESSIANRWAFVNAKRICVNCLRTHEGKCGFGHCKWCERYHHSLLHQDGKTAATPPFRQSSNVSEPSNSDETSGVA